MSVFDRLISLFDEHGASFRIIEHQPEGRSDLVAAVRGTSIGQGAKAIVCEIEGNGVFTHALAVVAGDRKVNLKSVALLVGGRKGRFAKPEVAESLTECIIGSIPPVTFNGALKLVVDDAFLEREKEIAFNAGRLDRSIVVNSNDYRRVAHPLVGPITA